MRIAILTCGMLPIPAIQGGAVENLIDFYLEYNDKKKLHDITVYSPWDEKVIKHPALFSDVNHYIYIDVTSRKARIARKIYGYFHWNEYYNHFIEYYFEKVYTNLKKRKFDYIILENCPGFAYKLSKRGFYNIILHLHNDLLNNTSRSHDNISNNIIRIITVSDYIKKRVSSVLSIEKIQTIHNGIDLQNFSNQKSSPIRRDELGFSGDDFIIVYWGRINKEKGVSELTEALLHFRDIPQIKMMILGSSFFDNTKNDDTFLISLKNKAKKIKDKIVFTGFIPYNQVAYYLKIADIAVLPSMWEEPFGLTIVESMAVGLPLITTRSGGIPEICEGAAIIVDRGDIVSNLITAISDLYEHPEKRKKIASAAIERAQQFDKEIYAKEIFSELNKL